MEEEFVQFLKGKKMGIMHENDIVIPAKYDHIQPFSDGLFNVTQGNFTAYFDAKGNIVIPFQDKYESYGDFTEGLARVKLKEKWGYINKLEMEIIEPQFHFADEFSDGVAIVRNVDGMHGAIDITGKLIIDYQFKFLSKFENGYAKFGNHFAWGLINKLGAIVLPQEYSYIDTVKNNKVKVQIKEGDDYKEGVFTIGGSTEWNNDLDGLNEFNRKYRQFSFMYEELIQLMYIQGCPCQYQRLRNYIQWDKPVSFMDQELLFGVFSKPLNKLADEIYQCKTCGTSYKGRWEEYSIALQVLIVKITRIGSFEEKGAKDDPVIPVSLGFRGYNLEGLKKKYKQTDNKTVIDYLKVEFSPNTLPQPRKNWIQRFFE